MCAVIVTIRTVLWSVMTIAGSLMILVALFTNQWLIGNVRIPSGGVLNSVLDQLNQVTSGVSPTRMMGLFIDCNRPEGNLIFEGECVPDIEVLEMQMKSSSNDEFPHAWKAGIACFIVGLAIMVLTVLLSLLTPCFRSCKCCSVFTFCGSVQAFSAVLFTLGLIAYPAGWNSEKVKLLCGPSSEFHLGNCHIGGAYWLAVAGTVCAYLASSLTAFAYKSTKSQKTTYRRQDGDTCICVP